MSIYRSRWHSTPSVRNGIVCRVPTQVRSQVKIRIRSNTDFPASCLSRLSSAWEPTLSPSLNGQEPSTARSTSVGLHSLRYNQEGFNRSIPQTYVEDTPNAHAIRDQPYFESCSDEPDFLGSPILVQRNQALATRPHEHTCPITKDTMVDPVVANDGNSYERDAITEWLRNCNRSPCTNIRLASCNLVANRSLRHLIEEWEGHE
jgi:hypothetical protein